MNSSPQQYVNWFRQSSPYIHSHRGRTFVISISGETVEHAGFASLIHDIALLNSLGVRLVLVHGARPQIEQQLKILGKQSKLEQGWRITGADILPGIEQAVGQVRLNIETKLSMGLINTPMAGAALRVISGNFVTARPYGIRNGIDFGHAGEVRNIDCDAIKQQLQLSNIVLLSPVGYSPTGEAFNCRSEDIATETAIALNADKLIFLMDEEGVKNETGDIIHQLNLSQAERQLEQTQHDDATLLHLASAVKACKNGVRRSHLISHDTDGALLLELYTRDGQGTLITKETYEGLRQASIDDVGGILELIQPLEEEGILSRRSREQLELEISNFTVCERDGMIIGCAALYTYEDKAAELACVAIHTDYRKQGRAKELLNHIEQDCKSRGINKLFILTTQTSHWFQEQGFVKDDIDNLPIEKRKLYNLQRNSMVFYKSI
ncbi:MAG: amino-acid N-acetyltransferase [Gammaproteobacteria bacterium]|nr:amino-acid N-acetyltransferase [Gammaproteobacteria bacterium]